MARKTLYPPSVKPGIPKLGELPASWTSAPFGELLEKIERPAKLLDEAEYQLVNAKRNRGGIVRREKLPGREIKVKTQFYTRRGDFLISCRQISHGACGIVPADLDGAIVSNEYDTLVARPDRLLLGFLDAFSHTAYFQQCCFHSSIGVDVEKMVFKLDRFLRLPMPLPPLPEQRKIVAILSSVDEAIQATQAVIEQTRRVKEGLLQELLTKGIGHTSELPRGWKQIGLLNEATIVNGQVDPRADSYRDWPLIAPNHIESNTGRLLAVETAAEQSAISGKYIVQPGEIVYCKIRPYLRKVWHADRKALCSADMYPIRAGSNLDPSYLAAVLLSDHFSRFADSQSARTGIPKINREQLATYTMNLPPLPEQRKIVAILSSVDEVSLSHLQRAHQLQAVKAGLLQDLLTGKVRVSA